MIVVSNLFNSRRMRLLQMILDISSIVPQQEYHKLSKLIHVKDIFGFFYLFWLWSIALKFDFKFDYLKIDNLFEVPRLYINLLAFQTDMLYVNCVCVLKACFKEINDNLENLRKLVMNTNSKWMCHKQKNSFLIMKLKILKKQHLMISNIVQILNITFSLHLFATVLSCFKQIVFFSYFNIITWQDGISLDLNIIYNVAFMSFVIYYIMRLMLIVWVCETGKNQAIKIGTIIHDMLNSINKVKIKDEVLKKM